MKTALLVGAGVGMALFAFSGGAFASVDGGAGGDVPADPAPDYQTGAALMAIRVFESNSTDSAYTLLNGGGRFSGFADHPAALGWGGTRLSDSTCRAAGYGPGCVSTAAGAYQIILPTWKRLKNKLGLIDFSPESQDAAAVELIRENGALADVQAGNFTAAINKLSHVWASMPGNYAAQRQGSLTAWLNAFTNNGGALA